MNPDFSRQDRKGRQGKQGADLLMGTGVQNVSRRALENIVFFLPFFACLARELQRFG